MSVVAVRDPGPMARLRDVVADADAPAEVFRLLTDDPPRTLPEIAKLWGLPRGRFVEFFTTTHADLYDTALKVIAADLAIQAMQAALDATPENVAVKKLQADVALRIAAKFDRLRFGETVRVDRTVTFAADAGLVGMASELLRQIAKQHPQEKLIAPEQVPDAIGADTAISAAEPARAALAPAEFLI